MPASEAASFTMISLALHTREIAESIREILSVHSIGAVLRPVDDSLAKGLQLVNVMIDEDDLPLAVRTLDSGLKPLVFERRKLAGVSNRLLIPIDFSDMSLLACRAGFELASRLSLRPLFLYACPVPYDNVAAPFGTALDPTDGEWTDNVEEAAVAEDILTEARKMMRRFAEDVRHRQKDGSLPDLKFDTDVREGVAEDVILDFTRSTPPALVVMATRGRNKRERDLIGSVTAEVIDACRVPVFAVPDNYALGSLRGIVRLAFFCNIDRQDLLTMESLMRMFDYPEIDVLLIPVSDRAIGDSKGKIEQMRDFLAADYKNVHFSTAVLSSRNFREEFEKLVVKHRLQMIIVPNKKKNILSRLFNPGIAHKLLFERDMPLLALPV